MNSRKKVVSTYQTVCWHIVASQHSTQLPQAQPHSLSLQEDDPCLSGHQNPESIIHAVKSELLRRGSLELGICLGKKALQIGVYSLYHWIPGFQWDKTA